MSILIYAIYLRINFHLRFHQNFNINCDNSALDPFSKTNKTKHSHYHNEYFIHIIYALSFPK